MALTKTVTQKEVAVMADGQVRILEETSVFDNGEFLSARKDHRFIDVGGSVTGETQLVKDVINGNLHDATRTAARQAVKDAEAEVVV